ncbi:hypothetical protein N7448_008961 [Penicillium atrosanguineum]|nr:hypothetical protein N7448_008961 [Penicillium atrosanguineum]
MSLHPVRAHWIHRGCTHESCVSTAIREDVKRETTGYFIPAKIVDNPPEKSHVVQDEPFGSIVPVPKWEDEEEVIQRANATDQGLGATLWCRNTE